MSSQTSTASLTMLIVIGLALIFTTLVGIFICACYRSPLSCSRSPRQTPVIYRDSTQPGRHRRHLISFEDSSPLCGLSNPFKRRSLVGSTSPPGSIRISPSQPTIFGDEKDVELSVKVVLTPPTPAKANSTISFEADDEDDYYNDTD